MAIQISGTTVIDNSRNLTNISSLYGCTGVASQAEAQSGTSNTKFMTPLRVAQAINALGGPTSMIKRVQRGSTTYNAVNPSTAVSITAVDLNKTFVSTSNRGNVSVGVYANSHAGGTGSAAAYLTSSTNLQVARGGAPGNPYGPSPDNSGVLYWEVVEFN